MVAVLVGTCSLLNISCHDCDSTLHANEIPYEHVLICFGSMDCLVVVVLPVMHARDSSGTGAHK